jgi:hypothetical protein
MIFVFKDSKMDSKVEVDNDYLSLIKQRVNNPVQKFTLPLRPRRNETLRR